MSIPFRRVRTAQPVQGSPGKLWAFSWTRWSGGACSEPIPSGLCLDSPLPSTSLVPLALAASRCELLMLPACATVSNNWGTWGRSKESVGQLEFSLPREAKALALEPNPPQGCKSPPPARGAGFPHPPYLHHLRSLAYSYFTASLSTVAFFTFGLSFSRSPAPPLRLHHSPVLLPCSTHFNLAAYHH